MLVSDERKEHLAEGTLISHLLELRDRMVRVFASVIIAFVPAACYRNEIFELLALPLLLQLPKGSSLIATSVISPFSTPIKLALFVAVFGAMPYILAQVWGFISPGLYRKEKRFAVPLLAASIILFYMGAGFAYQFVFPTMFHYFASTTPGGVQMMTDINNYLDFVLSMFLTFGLAFEVPVVVVLLTLTGLVTVEKLIESRGYVVIGISVVAAVLTPQDPLSMIMMGVPMWVLFEAGLIFARIMNRGKSEKSPAAAGTPHIPHLANSTSQEYNRMDMKIDGKRIKQEREQRAWTQEHLAGATGVSLRTIQRIETTGTASYDSLNALAAVFSLSVAELRLPEAALNTQPPVRTRWLNARRILAMAGAVVMASVVMPPSVVLQIPAAILLWLVIELGMRVWRSHRTAST
jgi:sec-independent protein translocase protein TatC